MAAAPTTTPTTHTATTNVGTRHHQIALNQCFSSLKFIVVQKSILVFAPLVPFLPFPFPFPFLPVLPFLLGAFGTLGTLGAENDHTPTTTVDFGQFLGGKIQNGCPRVPVVHQQFHTGGRHFVHGKHSCGTVDGLDPPQRGFDDLMLHRMPCQIPQRVQHHAKIASVHAAMGVQQVVHVKQGVAGQAQGEALL